MKTFFKLSLLAAVALMTTTLVSCSDVPYPDRTVGLYHNHNGTDFDGAPNVHYDNWATDHPSGRL